MNKEYVLEGFRRSRQEIENLQNQNNLLTIENRAYNRILSALESQRPASGPLPCGENSVWRLREQEESLAKEIEEEKMLARLNKELAQQAGVYRSHLSGE